MSKRGATPGKTGLVRGGVVLALVAYAIFYLMLTMGAASFIHECNTIVCGQLHQAIFAAVGAIAAGTAAYRVSVGLGGTATIVLLGTTPILIVHILLVVADPNEAAFFPISTSPPPLVSGAALLTGALRRKPHGAEL